MRFNWTKVDELEWMAGTGTQLKQFDIRTQWIKVFKEFPLMEEFGDRSPLV